MAEPNRLAAALSYEQDRPAFGNPNMLEQGRKMRERKQAEQIELSAQRVKSDLLAKALMRRYNPETPPGLSDTGLQTGMIDAGPQTLDEAAGLDPRVDRSTLLPYSQKEGLHVPAFAADLMKLATASNPQYSNLMQPEEAMPLATNVMGGGVVASRLAPAPAGSLGMNVWHGSPHRFPPTAKNPLGEFDPTKIGTGEGAQFYGVGAGYLAESKDKAKQFAETLGKLNVADKPQITNSYANSINEFTESQNWASKFSSKDEALKALHKEFNPQSSFVKSSLKAWDNPKLSKDSMAVGNAYLAKRWAIENPNTQFSVSKYLYKVDLPDEQIAKMLDWDKPLSQQPESVRTAVVNGMKQFKWPQKKIDEVLSEMNGQQVLNYISPSGNRSQASEVLRAHGVPGIRYLDEGSSGAGQGTSNFVVFDPKHMNIIGRE